jgi:hypothetical protein
MDAEVMPASCPSSLVELGASHHVSSDPVWTREPDVGGRLHGRGMRHHLDDGCENAGWVTSIEATGAGGQGLNTR